MTPPSITRICGSDGHVNKGIDLPSAGFGPGSSSPNTQPPQGLQFAKPLVPLGVGNGQNTGVVWRLAQASASRYRLSCSMKGRLLAIQLQCQWGWNQLSRPEGRPL